MQHRGDVSVSERLIAAGSYLTLGTIGMVWFLVSFFILKKGMDRFLALNIVQSFMLSIIYAVISLTYGIFIGILANLPFIGNFFAKVHIFLFETPVFHTMSFMNYIVLLILLYLSVIALFGKLPFVPFVTDTVKNFNM